MGADHTLLKRYGLSVEQRFSAEQIFLLNTALQHVISDGTAHVLSRYLPASNAIAGKTGTTNDLRESWFAGFSGDRLGVVWVGRDDNKPAGVTGATAALPVWGEIMRALHAQPLELTEPASIQWARVNAGSTSLPFIAGTEPAPDPVIPSIDMQTIKQGTNGIFNSIRRWIN